jgi:hypothetical protein
MPTKAADREVDMQNPARASRGQSRASSAPSMRLLWRRSLYGLAVALLLLAGLAAWMVLSFDAD